MTQIRILQKDSNRRGDLFGRLMADLFVALGYEQPRLNIHKSGREVDLQADHRLEKRRAIGECKATEKPIGGDDLNKFAGVLDVEHDSEMPTAGYFISLSGFTEPAKDQERQRAACGRHSIILLDQTRVVEELINGRLLIPPARATEVAGRFVGDHASREVDSNLELLAHERGWIWAVYYMNGKARIQFVLLHSDGTPLARALCEEIIDSDRTCGGTLHSLACLNGEAARERSRVNTQAALRAYADYLSAECGFIQLDGLPADSDVGSRRLQLENLFVPLHIEIPLLQKERHAVGAALREHQRLAILGPPGVGKSTLLKHLAIAYTDAGRRSALPQDLPSSHRLALFFRCRELREYARSSFQELIGVLSEREPIRVYREEFRAEVDRALGEGRVTLLVDGLDEIADPGDRAAFVCTLRSTLLAYPETALVLTSREAGFRHVAAHLASVCSLASLSPLDEDDVRRFTMAWNREVVGDTDKVRQDAEQLSQSIICNDRIRQLAINPLLLTILLLVKRWLGSLPTKRAVLYGKAVEVLLMTWNTEGYDPIPEDEALPQLCYVAASMMLRGVQRISRPSLARLLQEARQAFPSELAYIQITVDQFIRRIEERSGLMMMTGHDVENSQLVEFFEFRHFTFQEYLTAKAFVQGWVGMNPAPSLVAALEPHLRDEKWEEVIALAAVLAGKNADPLIRRLSELCSKDSTPTVVQAYQTYRSQRVQTYRRQIRPGYLLGACLADEAAASPETIRMAVRALIALGRLALYDGVTSALCRGKYGSIVHSEVRSVFRARERFEQSILLTLQAVAYHRSRPERSDLTPYLAESLRGLQSQDLTIRCEAAACCDLLAQRVVGPDASQVCEEIARALAPLLLDTTDPRESFFAVRSFLALGSDHTWCISPHPDVLLRLYILYRQTPEHGLREAVQTAIAHQLFTSRSPHPPPDLFTKEPLERLQEVKGKEPELPQYAALYVAWYWSVLDNKALQMWAVSLGSPEEGEANQESYRVICRELGIPVKARQKNSSSGGSR